MLRVQPHGEDGTNGARATPISINARGMPPGEDRVTRGSMHRNPDWAEGELENSAQRISEAPDGKPSQGADPRGIDFLDLVRRAEDQAMLYVNQFNRKAWSQTLRAFHNEHYIGSKYTRPDWRGRSRLFVPKTRAAVRKDVAATTASLFNTIDAITCLPGYDGDPMQRASAAIMQELVNYRTNRTSGKASFPWFLIAAGARMDADLTGVCCTKQCWKQTFRLKGTEEALVQDQNGVHVPSQREVYELDVDRPDMLLIPPENFVIDPAANWLNPAQSSAYFMIKWPMQIEEIRDKQNAPINPWKEVPEDVLRSTVESGKFDTAAIRRAREFGLDRLDEVQTGTNFQVVWVYEVFMRVNGEDWNFWSVGSQAFLTDVKPTREAYPEQFGERPIALGYGQLESHRIYPMSPAESWQPLQMETNDIRNLMLDATKQNVMPISKVRRGRQIDLDQVKRRSSGSSILVNEPDDVTWETPPSFPQQAVEMQRELDLEFDDLAGQQNYGSVETNNALGKTLGGLKLAAGAANAVQEYDIRVFLETWASPALAQIVKLEQYYESDPVVLGLCGQKAQLFQKFGINAITDELLEQEINVRVSVGLGAGDPQQRLAKFQSAASIVGPLLGQTQEFQSGQVELDWEALCDEVFGAAGYHDGGKRFFKVNPGPRQNPMADLKTQELQAKIQKDQNTGKGAIFTGLANLAKVALGKKELEADVVDRLLGYQHQAIQTGFDHGHRHNDQMLSARDHGHRHAMDLLGHQRNIAQDARQAQQDAMAQAGAGTDIGGAASSPSPPNAAPPGASPQGTPSVSAPPPAGMPPPGMPAAPPGGPGGPPGPPGGPMPGGLPPMSGGAPMPPPQMPGLPPGMTVRFIRDPHSQRIISAVMMPAGQRLVGEPPSDGPPPQVVPQTTAEPQEQPMPEAEPKDDMAAKLGAIMNRLQDMEDRLSKPKTIKRDPRTNAIIGVE
jgi:hypothetical protein